MANEITINASMVYEDAEGANASISVVDKLVTVTTKKPVYLRQTITTSEVAINLGGLASVGYVMFKNLDSTNYIEVKVGTAGAICGKMFPGETYGPCRLGSGMQAPFAIANTASCEMEIEMNAP